MNYIERDRQIREQKAAALAELEALAKAVESHRAKTGHAKLMSWRAPQAAVSYNTVHQRLRRHRGPASTHSCTRCPAQAAHWAYDHGDPSELVEDGLVYSLDPDRYIALCRSCHHAQDVRC